MPSNWYILTVTEQCQALAWATKNEYSCQYAASRMCREFLGWQISPEYFTTSYGYDVAAEILIFFPFQIMNTMGHVRASEPLFRPELKSLRVF